MALCGAAIDFLPLSQSLSVILSVIFSLTICVCLAVTSDLSDPIFCFARSFNVIVFCVWALKLLDAQYILFTGTDSDYKYVL